ncbi:MAG: hypothetical protein CM1200mP18_19530 [Gammaproteobacteria bacterium]|nr:MAG: hypothetical protein CM1200mP18_19530 [Gammaproteobacteria bacterium]
MAQPERTFVEYLVHVSEIIRRWISCSSLIISTSFSMGRCLHFKYNSLLVIGGLMAVRWQSPGPTDALVQWTDLGVYLFFPRHTAVSTDLSHLLRSCSV